MKTDKTVIDIRKQEREKFANTLDCELFYSLKEVIEAKSTKKLKDLASFLHIKGYTKMDRTQLAMAICENYSDTEVVASVLRGFEHDEWALFQKVTEKKQSVMPRAKFSEYETLQWLGLMQTFTKDDKVIFVVPKEIRAIYRLLKKGGFVEEKDWEDLIGDYALAAVHLYGIISQDEFVAIINDQNERKIDVDELFPILLGFIYAYAPYEFFDEYIVHDAFVENGYKDVLRWADGIADKPRYIPEKEEFLRYAEWDYYEQTPQIEALKAFFATEIKLSCSSAAELVDDIHDLCAQEVKLQVIMDMLDDKGIEFASLDMAQKFVQYYAEMHNHTRLWLNKGHTPAETFTPYRPTTSEPRRVVKVGRNEPCPCGSGKKYKKCCGFLS